MTTEPIIETKPKRRVKNFALLSNRAGAMFLTPAGLLVSVFVIVPFFWVIFVSFTNRTLLGSTALNPEFVGLANYFALFDGSNFFQRGQFGFSLILTTQFVLASALLGQALLGLLLAWLIQTVPPAVKRLTETFVIAAWILPEVVIGFAWFAFLDRDQGTLNALLGTVGLPPGDFLLQQPFWVIVVFNTWRGAAFSMMLFSSAFSSIPPSYFQAADVAGASSWQKFKDIGLPLIRGHIVTDLILITMWTFNTFTPFLLTNGGPSYRTELVSIYNYRVAFNDFQFGKGAAVGVIMMLINLAFALIYLSIGRKKKVR
ncbi:MAG: sugar ABC transporter permease [Alphaproteobacteria bacterium]|jgi:multiple sugar transport system permease protein|uniref:carbohydrate ABC transporter permease n=1 Tax=Devosia sp. XGJD_8 TaxID=3391187 RepID=UPI001D67E9FB|nr:sugar ABC transporter permease [Alphaproteobacteria bacterium]MBU1563077.1 sugar ABC transporter permease [Alphaproteobacteria bacterium]MBU2304272.1 sugar ABC transporter permease [Alphaproteobacteria bacterium]MBU2368273.1 sugar ABC transporter permease [Alphaproteobacteria bacterium]